MTLAWRLFMLRLFAWLVITSVVGHALVDVLGPKSSAPKTVGLVVLTAMIVVGYRFVLRRVKASP